MPAVPDETERAYLAPVSSQNFSSNALQRGPVVIQPDFKHETTPFISFSPIEGLLKGRKSFLISIAESPLASEPSKNPSNKSYEYLLCKIFPSSFKINKNNVSVQFKDKNYIPK
jgi:hypothetical protein